MTRLTGNASACSTCPTILGRVNRSGQCRSCIARRNATDPAMIERRRAGILARLADPETRAAHVARCIRNGRDISDELRERRREHGRRMVPRLREASAAITPAMRADAGRKRSETVLAWCPPEWRDRYRELKKRGRPAAAAKVIVLALIAGKPMPPRWAKQKAQLDWCPPSRREDYRSLRVQVGAARARAMIEAEMTPFERQLARVAAGAPLVARFKPTTHGPDMTLGGVATGMI
jgi:hypothetical protein